MLIAALLASLTISAAYAATTYKSSSSFTYSVKPDITLALPSSMGLGSVASGVTGTQTFSNALQIVGSMSTTYTISGSLTGNFSAFSAYEVQISNSGGPACTLTIAQPTCQFSFPSPKSESWDIVVSYTTAVLQTQINDTGAPISIAVSTTG